MKSSSFRVGWFLATRQLKRSSIWTTGLIIFIMFLTFLNLTVIGGLLVGLIEGSSQESREQYSGDVIISTLPTKNYIENSTLFVSTLEQIPEILEFSPRYLEGGAIQANYKEKTRAADRQDEAGTQIVGIDPTRENAVTGVAGEIAFGEFLNENEEGQVVLGSSLLAGYARGDAPGFDTIENVEIGDKVRIEIKNNLKEFTVKGIIRSKEGNVDRRAFVVDRDLRQIIGRNDLNVDEIAIRIRPGSDLSPQTLKNRLNKTELSKFAVIQTYREAQGQFLEDIAFTFGILGTVIGSIGLVVASITIFIVIFINAITRRKFIGILKGIGIDSFAIELSYVIQSLFFAIIGASLGVAVLYLALVPFFQAYPINFPFSDGILFVTTEGTLIRIAALFISTLVAGYIPAKIIIRRNTLDAILGR